jgi:hypothetical protein
MRSVRRPRFTGSGSTGDDHARPSLPEDTNDSRVSFSHHHGDRRFCLCHTGTRSAAGTAELRHLSRGLTRRALCFDPSGTRRRTLDRRAKALCAQSVIDRAHVLEGRIIRIVENRECESRMAGHVSSLATPIPNVNESPRATTAASPAMGQKSAPFIRVPAESVETGAS